MKIALECSEVLHRYPTGISNYVIALRSALEESSELHQADRVYSCYKWSRALRAVSSERRGHHVRWHVGSEVADLGSFDIAHSPNAILLRARKAKTVLTIHDVAIFRPELQAIRDYTALNLVDAAQEHMQWLIDQVDGIACASQTTADDVQTLFRLRGQRVAVCPPAPYSLPEQRGPQNSMKQVRSRALLHNLGLQEGKFFLFVGSISIRKNIVNLVEAYARSGLAADFPLVLAGAPSMGMHLIESAIERTGMRDRVRILGYVDVGEVEQLYNSAAALVYVSYYEGFGMPIVEAMRVGCPVLCSSLGASPETAAGHALCVDPHSIDEISKGLHTVLTRSSEQRDAARHYALSVTWTRTADHMRALYHELLGS